MSWAAAHGLTLICHRLQRRVSLHMCKQCSSTLNLCIILSLAPPLHRLSITARGTRRRPHAPSPKTPSANGSIITKRSLQKRGKSTEILNQNEVLLSFSKLSHQDAIRIFARRLLRRKRFTAKIATCLTATHPVQAPPAPTGISRPKKLATTVGGAMTSASPQAYQVPAESVPDHRE
ncbi:hypothetical protein ACVMH6_004457 [Rhizobium leguminosarum]|jgi:hypothetical protein